MNSGVNRAYEPKRVIGQLLTSIGLLESLFPEFGATWIDGLVLMPLSGGDLRQKWSFEPDGWVMDTAVAGSVVHTLLCDGSVQQVDVSSPRNPRDLGVYDDAHRAVTGKVGDSFMLVQDQGWCSDLLESHLLVSTDQ